MFDYKFIIMKISEVIKKLQEIKEEHGDREVVNAKAVDVTLVMFEILSECAVIMTEEDELKNGQKNKEPHAA